ncbi:MAG: phosphoribosylaminoimidazolesuccinocarboxamide synthase [Planctomycetes bacterium]|nr:phosphoribosylaminoimidazolesuccinocarboxamide synthase [Planctomycetota bacterium]
MSVFETNLEGLRLVSRGKVRDLYDLGDSLLFVASDRLSAFDVVLPTPIEDKGRVLTQLSVFWFSLLENNYKNHLITADVSKMPAEVQRHSDVLHGRSMLVKKVDIFPVECVVRGYLAGSGLKEYNKTGAVCGIKLPAGLVNFSKLPEPIFTPATKAEHGDHDENIGFEVMVKTVGKDTAEKLRDLSLGIYRQATDFAATKGIVLADTKFEFGLRDGEILLADEALTPDSSRYFRLSDYKPGESQKSFDKQYVRDYLETLDWGKTYPGPELPAEVVRNTRAKYTEIYKMLTGKNL